MKKSIFVFGLFLLITLSGFSQKEVRDNRGYANFLVIPGSYVQTHDDKFENTGGWSSGFLNTGNRVVIELGIDEDKHLPHLSPMKICAKFDLQLTDSALAVTTLTAQQLDISYNPGDLTRYKDKAQLIFPKFYKAKVYNINITYCASSVTCLSCTNTYTSSDVYLQAGIETARTYTAFTYTSVVTGSLVSDAIVNDELRIVWPFLSGASLYELEYTFIDDYVSNSISSGTYAPASSLTYDFDQDATRIITPNNEYAIPLTYEHGYIVYRVRPVAVNILKQRLEGAWYPSVASGTVGSASCKRAIAPTFPSQKLNWQSTKTFAESGKTGVGVTFEDAIGLPRQSLARLNSESKTIVQSSLFDFYGRPAVEILPAPVSGLNLNYRFGLNIYTTSTVFDKKVFERSNTNSYCSPSSFSLNSSLSLGAANYYSANNPNKQAFQGYLPDAEGFSFTQLQYTNDGLNRISKRTLPGKQHALSSGKEIKYITVKPCQVQLDRMFGSEAGRSAYYQRTSTTDPNGQVSLEFKDIHGRTVASCLKGTHPKNLDALPNQSVTATLTEPYHLAPVNVSDPLSGCKEVNASIEIYKNNENEVYNYQATWGTAFTGTCDPNACFHCVYDVTLSITRDCGDEVFDHDQNILTPMSFKGSIGRPAPYTSTVNCSQYTFACLTGSNVSLSSSVTIQFPTAGKYKINKKICVSNAPLADYTNTYLKASCGVDKCKIYNDVLNTIDFSGCFPQTCSSCYNSITQYSANAVSNPTTTLLYPGPVGGGTAPSGESTPGSGSSPVVYTSTMTPQQVSKAYEECAVFCSSNSRCSTYDALMEADFYPGTGQFAATSSASPTWSYSIFNPANLLTGSPTWSLATLSYSNAANQLDYVQVNGVNKTPSQLSQADYISNFRKSWAKAFMKYHPDLCKKYFYCTMLGSAYDYDETFNAIHHADKACSNGGYWFPVRYGTYSNYKPSGSCTSSTLGIDPVTRLTYTSVTAFSNAISSFTNEIKQNFRNTGRDIYEYTAMQSHTAIAAGPVTYSLGQDICTADEDWSSFKFQYLRAKQILYSNLLKAFLQSPSSYGAGSASCTAVSSVIVSHFPEPLKDLDSEFPIRTGTISSSSFYTLALNPPSSTLTPTSTYTNALSSYTTSMGQFTAQVVPSGTFATSQCSIACISYTSGWHTDLQSTCTGYSTASTATQTAILNAMVEVCKLGCDYATNLMGASSTSPGLIYTLPGSSPSQTVSNFQQILNYYLPAASCSTIVLNGPPLYPASSGTYSPKQLSSCKCDIILETAKEFPTSTYSTTMSEWQYFELKYGFDLTDYYKLKCACQTAAVNTWSPGYVWTAPEINALNTYTSPVDPDLACRSCLSCTEVAMAIDSLTLPVSMSMYSDVIGKINHSPGNQLYVRNALNARFGLHTLQTYLDLYQDCNSFTSTASAYTFSNTLTQTGFDAFLYLKSIVNSGNFLNTHTMTLCTDDKFFLSSLFTGTLPIIPGYGFTSTQNSNSLTLVISKSVTPIASILLVKPSGSGSWSSFTDLVNFVAYCPPPLSGGPKYGFKVDALDNVYASVSLTGAITCTAWPVSYLSYGSYTVPSLCPELKRPEKNACVVNLIKSAYASAQDAYEKESAATITSFQTNWKNYCFNTLNETFTRSYAGADEYNYTLYYYDLAGNLQRTVPPNGADPGILSSLTSTISYSTTLLPAYSGSAGVAMNFVSDYKYDSYNNLIEDSNIDGGKTAYYYDPAGILLASQNARQLAASSATDVIYSYSLYDNMGRIKEMGQVHFPSTPTLTGITRSLFTSVVATGTLEQITRVYYDRPATTGSVLAAFTNSVQQNLRNRIAYIIYMDVNSGTATNYDHATYYSYDDHGNVTELVQHNKQLDVFNQGFRNIKYEFELISGNMLKATYQHKKPDQFMHKYYYDADNRLKEVFTSKDDINWDRDAKYFYYEHGPLARVEYADKKVQATDYLYTIHGWIKSVNNDALSYTSDAGKDGAGGNKYLSSYQDVHKWIPGDAMGFSLNYYNTGTTSDYKAIKTFTTGDVNPHMSISGFTNTADPFYLDNNSTFSATDNGPDLFNGNISSMTTSFLDKDPGNTIAQNTAFPLLTAYRYDQLQRLTKMKSFRSYSSATLTWNPGSSGNYNEAYRMSLSYDRNGNILSLIRNGSGTLTSSSYGMDSLQYRYYNSSASIAVTNTLSSSIVPLPYNSNKLRCIDETVFSGNYGTDIDASDCESIVYEEIEDGSGYKANIPNISRYAYDASGNLIYDKGEYIEKIEWTVDRKVKRITRDAGEMQSVGIPPRPDIQYEYNAQRQRVVKIVMPRNPSGYGLLPASSWLYTYYVYDASGNVMSTYKRTASQVSGSTYKDVMALEENSIYGSKRLALARPQNTLATWTYSFNNSCGLGDACRFSPTAGPTADITFTPSGFITERHLGYKDFELSNHLGNVLTTVSDRKVPGTFTASTTNCLKEFDFNLSAPSVTDIVPNNISLSVPGGSLLCQLTAAGGISGLNPNFGNNLTPGETYRIDFDFNPGTLTSGDGLYLVQFMYNTTTGSLIMGTYFWPSGTVTPQGHYTYTFVPSVTGPNYDAFIAWNAAPSTHSFTIDNLKMCPLIGTVGGYTADITSTTDYYPGGAPMPGRTWQGGDKYRYSHNGHEKEDEIYTGAQSAEYWMYDSRILRRWEMDPRTYEYQSPYAAFNNNPIFYADPLGLEGRGPVIKWFKKAWHSFKEFVKHPFDKAARAHYFTSGKSKGSPTDPKTRPTGKKPIVIVDPNEVRTLNLHVSLVSAPTSAGGGVPTSGTSIFTGIANYVDPVQALDDYFDYRQNMHDLRPSMKVPWMSGITPFGSGPNSNTGFQGNSTVQMQNNDGVDSWLPGGSIGGLSYNPAAKDGAALGTILAGVLKYWSGKSAVKSGNALNGMGSTLGEGYTKIMDKPTIQNTNSDKVYDTIYKTVLIKSKSPYKENIIITRENGQNKDTFFFAPSEMMKK